MGRPGRSNLGKTSFPTRSRRRRLLLGRLDGDDVGEEQLEPEADVTGEGGAVSEEGRKSEADSTISMEPRSRRDLELNAERDAASAAPRPALRDAVDRSSFAPSHVPHLAEHASHAASETITRRQHLHVSRNSVASIQRLLEGEQPLTWIFAGDQMTVGSPLDDSVRSYSERLAAQLRRIQRRQTDVVINTAVPGDTSRTLLANLHWRVLRFRPHLVSVMVGLEDALAGEISVQRFQENLEQIVMAVRDHDANLILQTPVCPNDDPTRCRLATYVAAIYEIAEVLSVPLIDHWSNWGTLERDLRASLLGVDGILPSAVGHQSIADTFNQVLKMDSRTGGRVTSQDAGTARSIS